jgi:hypothetical protein
MVKEGDLMEFIITDKAKKQLLEKFEGQSLRIFPKIKT